MNPLQYAQKAILVNEFTAGMLILCRCYGMLCDGPHVIGLPEVHLHACHSCEKALHEQVVSAAMLDSQQPLPADLFAMLLPMRPGQ